MPTKKPHSPSEPHPSAQRDQYSGGDRYRKDDLSRGADISTDHGWAGGDHSKDDDDPQSERE